MNYNEHNNFNNQYISPPQNQEHINHAVEPYNKFTESRPLNTQIENPEIEYIHKEQRMSTLWHIATILLVFVASVIIHKYGILVVYGTVGMWVSTAIAVYLSPNEERQNIKKIRLWVAGYVSIAIIFDMILYNLTGNVEGYGLDASVVRFLDIMRLMIFVGTPIMQIGILVKRVHFNWEAKNNEERTQSYMRKGTNNRF